jgi:branched-chain amino acid transport system permease protein
MRWLRMTADLLNAVLQGVMVGGLYALLAAGLSLIFGVMRLVNIAHGDLIVLAGYIAVVAVNATGVHPLLAIVLVVPLMAALGYGLQRLVLNRVVGPDILPPLLVTFGVSVIIQNALLEVFSADSQKLQAGALETMSIALPGGLAVGVLPLLMFAAAVAVIGGLQLLFYRTELGRAFRATSDDRETAQLMGIDHGHLFAMAMAIALAVCGLAGVLLGVRSIFDPSSGPPRLLFAFEAVVIGGLGSLWGTLAGGVILGVAQGIGAEIDPGWQVLAGHLVFLAVLVARPQGLFARAGAA